MKDKKDNLKESAPSAVETSEQTTAVVETIAQAVSEPAAVESQPDIETADEQVVDSRDATYDAGYIESAISALDSARYAIEQVVDIESGKLDASKFNPADPIVIVVKGMMLVNDSLTVESACDLLKVSDADREIVVTTLSMADSRQTRLQTAYNRLVAACHDAGIGYNVTGGRIKRAPRSNVNPAKSNPSQGRSKVVGDFRVKCQFAGCSYEARGSQKSLAINNLRLHMESKHGISRDEFDAKYRQAAKESLQTIGETKVEYY